MKLFSKKYENAKPTLPGFTLVELLAVLILLGMLSLIVVPVVNKIIKESKEELYNNQINNIEQSARNWAAKNVFNLPEVNSSVNVTICDLEKTGFMDIDVKNPKTDNLFYKDSYVTITNTGNGFNYEYIENSGTEDFVCEGDI